MSWWYDEIEKHRKHSLPDTKFSFLLDFFTCLKGEGSTTYTSYHNKFILHYKVLIIFWFDSIKFYFWKQNGF